MHVAFLRGQASVLQLSFKTSSPKQTPPYCSSSNFDREFVRVPPPQVTEHCPTCHSPHTQSTAKLVMNLWSAVSYFLDTMLTGFHYMSTDEYPNTWTVLRITMFFKSGISFTSSSKHFVNCLLPIV